MTSSNYRRISLFIKLMGAFTLILLVVGTLVTWMSRRVTRDEFTLYITVASRRQAQALVPLLSSYYQANGTWDGVEEVLRTPPRDRHPRPEFGIGPPGLRGTDIWEITGTRALVVDTIGRVAADTAGELVGVEVTAEDLAAGVPISLNGERVGTVLVSLRDQSSAQNEAFLHQVNRAIVLAVLIGSAAALGLSGIIAWGVTRPLRQLTVAAEAIAEGNLQQTVDIAPGDEVGDLAAAFNQMSVWLTRAEQLRQQMTADIAHELRTPITVIQGNVDALQDGVFPLTAEALEPIRAKTSLLARLVEDLRQLALAEAGQLTLDRQPADLCRLLDRIITGFRAEAEAKQIVLALECGDKLLQANIDPQRIEQVMVNLLSNAIRHTPARGKVHVTAVLQAGSLRVEIKDTGTGIPPNEIANVFERFYRVEKGRARERDGSGSGLGLAVARSIVEAHGGEIGAESQPGEGATFWFTLPVVPPPDA
ncbi:MAG: sensor histidine kinase [Anaerolineae bacterium]